MTTLFPAAPVADILHFLDPMPGFEQDVEFTLTDIDPDGLLVAMRSTRDPGLRFVLTPAECFFPGYRPVLGDAVTDVLGVAAGTSVSLMLVLTIGSDLHDATANLRAPIVIAAAAQGVRAVQVVLDDESLSMREPILPVAPPE